MRTQGPSTAETRRRMCVGCRARRPASELIRLVARDGGLQVDLRRRLGGRGVNLCPELACLDLATKRRVWARSLRREVHFDRLAVVTEIADALRRDIARLLRDGRRSGAVVDASQRAVSPPALEALHVDGREGSWLPSVAVVELGTSTRVGTLAMALTRFTLEGAGAMKARPTENG